MSRESRGRSLWTSVSLACQEPPNDAGASIKTDRLFLTLLPTNDYHWAGGYLIITIRPQRSNIMVQPPIAEHLRRQASFKQYLSVVAHATRQTSSPDAAWQQRQYPHHVFPMTDSNTHTLEEFTVITSKDMECFCWTTRSLVARRRIHPLYLGCRGLPPSDPHTT
jgi:hypothetical protein